MIHYLSTMVIVAVFLTGSLTLGHMAARLIRLIIRAADKSKMKAAVAKEAYYNQLYEESLYEHLDNMAIKAAKEMERVQNDYYY